MKTASNSSETDVKSLPTPTAAQLYRFQDYELDCSQYQLRRYSEVVPLNRKSFDLLLYLVRAAPRMVGKDELFEALWPGQFVEENNLARQMSILRKVLSPGGEPTLIETVQGRGYRFRPPVEAVTAPEAGELAFHADHSVARVTLEEEIQTDLAPASMPRRRPATAYWVAALSVLLVAAGAWFGWQWWQDRQGGEPVQAVLMPLQGNTGDALLDRALNDALRFDLSQSPFVNVVSSSRVSSTLKDMQRKPDEPLTQDLAREICERTNSQAVVKALLARSGQQYLLTGEAVSCVDGSSLASTTREARRAEDLPLKINQLIGTLRGKLGESRRSVARFTTPRVALETTSLDALKAASQAGILNQQGKFAEAAAIYKQAIAYDPNFAQGYFDLGIQQIGLEDEAGSKANFEKAYALRASASPLMQITFTARYQQIVTGDVYGAEQTATLWTQLYPQNPLAWNNLTIIQATLGDYQPAVESAKRAVSLRPNVLLLQSLLAITQIYTGDMKAARASADRAVSLAPDADFAQMVLARLAYATEDNSLFQQQLNWLAAHPKSPLLLIEEAQLAISRGQFRQAIKFAAQAATLNQQQGSPATAATRNKEIATELIYAGDQVDGISMLKKEALNPDQKFDLLAMAVSGDAGKAEHSLEAAQKAHPQDTFLKDQYTPLIRAWNALAGGHPQDALSALNQPGVLDDADGRLRWFRGNALLQLNRPHLAEIEFRKILDYPGRDTGCASSLAWIGLGRALRAEGNTEAAAEAYRQFLKRWDSADPDAAMLQAAKRELAAL